MSRTAAILVNWRQPELTLRAVAALGGQTVPVSVIVVENGSGDGSASRLREEAASRTFTIVESDRNLGFGGGCNLGIREAIKSGAEAIWLVNNDAVPSPDCLERMLERLAEAGSRAIVGCRIVDASGVHEDHSGGTTGWWSLRGRDAFGEDEYLTRPFGWITGASLLAPTTLYDEVGLFDEGFFMYWEDADLAERARKAGYVLAVAEAARVSHTAGTSSENQVVERYRWHLRSHRRFLGKHHAWPMLTRFLVSAKYAVGSVLDRDWRRLAMVFEEMLPGGSRAVDRPMNRARRSA